MAQDTALLRYLLKWARRAPWSWSQRDLTFEFDWTDDYISSNATIGRTGYDMNVSWNVSTGSDADGSYIQFNGNRDHAAWTWTKANIGTSTTPAFTQTTDFTFSCKFKASSYPVNNYTWLFGSTDDFAICMSTGTLRITSKPTYSFVTIPYTLWTAVTLHVVYQSSSWKAFVYKDWVLQNAWWTAMSPTFTTNARYIGDDGSETTANTSTQKKIYHACIRNKALTQAEIDADIALWNTAKNDPSIVAYYIPDNLTYNTQYLTAPKTFWWAGRSVRSNATVTTNNATDPNWATTASTYVINAAGTQITNAVEQSITSISWGTLASKTFIVKAFVRVVSWSNTFRLKCSHAGVADYYSSNQVATTTRQEFTFTQTFTSSTSWTGINAWLTSDTSNTAWSFEVRNVRLFLVNETLRDESPNIWWFIWWKTPLVMSARIKPWVDASNTTSSQVIIKAPRHYLQLRSSTNILYFRSETSLEARGAPLWWTAILWTWNRNKVHILWVKYRDWTGRRYKSYVNWVLTSWSQTAYSSTLRPAGSIYTTQLLVWKDNTATYYTWDIRDIREYTFTWSFTDADALAIYNGGEPTSSGVTKYLQYRPPVGEVWTTTQDQSPNDRDWTLNGWVTRNYI